MDAEANVRVVLEVFAAIEQRDAARFLAHPHPDCTICWPPSLPWNDGLPGRPDKDGHHGRSWLEMWAPLSPLRSSGSCTLRSSPPPTTGWWCGGTSGDAAPPG
jgi:ketosteroid isomerase-like protein